MSRFYTAKFKRMNGVQVMMGLSRGLLVTFILVMAGIAYLDYLTGKDVAVWGLYLAPVGVAGWMGGFRAGALLSAVACGLMFIDGLAGGYAFSGMGYFLLASRLYRKQMLKSAMPRT